ncbi:MAG: SH3 domain-containing protein [Clostridiales bacterium]|nr:SH3 domain-containing protein [Clostridiales bacterium]
MKTDIKKIISVVCVLSVMGAFAACGKKTQEPEETNFADITPTPVPVETTATPTTTIPVYSGPLPSSDIAVTWSETTLETPVVMYAAVSEGEFLRVRKGPSTEYDIVGTLTRNQQVQIVAVTDSSWYKTIDGFYISSTYLSQSAL